MTPTTTTADAAPMTGRGMMSAMTMADTAATTGAGTSSPRRDHRHERPWRTHVRRGRMWRTGGLLGFSNIGVPTPPETKLLETVPGTGIAKWEWTTARREAAW